MRLFLTSLFIVSLFWAGNKFSSQVLAATDDADVVVAECKKRTGLSDSGCIVLIKKYMTTERCQEYTDLSAKECEKRIASLKEDPKFQGKKETTTPPLSKNTIQPDFEPQAVAYPAPTTLRERILAAKREKEKHFALVQAETEAVIVYLRHNGQDTQILETALREFEQKKRAVFLAYDRYQSIAESVQSTEGFAFEGPRLTVLEVLRDATGYYRSIVLKELQQAVAHTP